LSLQRLPSRRLGAMNLHARSCAWCWRSEQELDRKMTLVKIALQ
jgi:hypothetical protein